MTSAARVVAQVPVDSEVRQLVTLSFTPGAAGAAREVFLEHAVPLYRNDEAMLSFRAFSEIESSIPLDLIVISAFEGMGGMDRSNATLAQSGIGAFYERIGPLVASHHDQFIELLPSLGNGDPSAERRTALVWYRLVPGQGEAFEAALEEALVPYEEMTGVPSATGRFLLSDGWHYLRILGFDSLGGYQGYWQGVEALGDDRIASLTVARRDAIVSSIPELAVR